MFDFLFHKRRSEVARILSGRVNTHCASNLHPGARRASRSSYSEVVWLVRFTNRNRPDFDNALPVVSKDISPVGLSLVHTAPVDEERVIVGLRNGTGMVFVQCNIEHTTPLGCGYFQIGLNPDQLVSAPDAVCRSLLSRFDHEATRQEA